MAYYLIKVYSIPSDGVLTGVTLWDYLTPDNPIDVMETAYSSARYYNENLLRGNDEGVTFVCVYDTKTPLYNIEGTNISGLRGSQPWYAEGIPFEAARFLCNYFNNNHIPITDYDVGTCVTYNYFLPSSTIGG